MPTNKFLLLAALALAWTTAIQAETAIQAKVVARRSPQQGLQPKVVKDADGTVHLLAFTGDPAKGNLFYARSRDDGAAFDAAVQVNTSPGSAMAIGTVRGAQLAIGRQGRAHVSWMGSSLAQPRATDGAAPMLYARLDDRGKQFEAERNVIVSAVGLDGGGSVAADSQGNVFVAWHASPLGERGEERRRVWLAASHDDGLSFAPEQSASSSATGACGCCGLRAAADNQGRCYLLYRAATAKVHRDMYVAVAGESAAARETKLEPWDADACVMSTSDLLLVGERMFGVWETKGEISVADLSSEAPVLFGPARGPGNRKHPALAVNQRGELLVAWTQGTGWQRGGSVHYQLFDLTGQPLGKAQVAATDLPAWSSPSAFARRDGSFLIYY